MRRYASIDFLRGSAMLLMLMLHVVMTILDIGPLINAIDQQGIINIFALLVLPYMGGLAGFFLMVSAIGNMVSMTRSLEKGRSPKDMIIKQIMGGFLLLIFAMLTEGVIGYHGAFGEAFKHLNDPTTWSYSAALSRGYHFETIHTIAWCVIVNGLVHGLLVMKIDRTDFKKMAKTYIILAIIVLAITPLMWLIGGSPYSNNAAFYPVLGESPFIDHLLAILRSPIAGAPEPIFPYLACSFIGSVIGLYMTQDREKIKVQTLSKIAKIGFLMFWIGLIGVFANVIYGIINVNLDAGLELYQKLWDHRYWTAENGAPILGWLFQFTTLNGFAMCAITTIIRLVEFRGISEKFAAKTVYIRRLGFIAFTVYCIQFIYYINWFIVTWVLTFINPAEFQLYSHLGWGGVIVIILMTQLSFYILTYFWEKGRYIGSLEWTIGTIAAYLIPGKKVKRDDNTKKMKWYEVGLLDVDGAFYNAEWLNIIKEDEVDHKGLADSRISRKMSMLGIIFPPFAFVSYNLAKTAIKKEGVNKYNTFAKNFGLFGIIFFIVWVIVTLFVSLSTLGVTL